MFLLAHLSDPHLPLPQPMPWQLIGKRGTGYVNWLRKRRRVHDPAVRERIIDDLKAQQSGHIAVTGDLANIALPLEFVRGRAFLESLGTPRDVSLVPGNHDIYVRGAAAMAERHWGDYMRGDDGRNGFPYLRRRGNTALIGLSTGVPTLPLSARGWLDRQQLADFSALLAQLKNENVFRVVMIHHPPVSPRSAYKRMADAPAFLSVIAEHGADLVIHGHDHVHMINRLHGPNRDVSAVGVPSASARPGVDRGDAGYNLYRIGGERGRWTCEMISRGIDTAGGVTEIKREMLLG